MSRYVYTFIQGRPVWITFLYDSDGKLIEYSIRRWIGRFWINTYRYDNIRHLESRW